jgi:hypothetical protein
VRKQLIVASITAAALGMSASGATGAGGAKKCGNVSPKVGNIRATKTTCKVAKAIAKADAQGKGYYGWTCKSRRINTGASVTCTAKGGKKVTFQIAD